MAVHGETIKTLSGTVTKISGSQVYFKTASAATYAAEVGNGTMIRRYGAPLKFSEILVGDKVEARGALWNDNSMSASYFRDASLYVHNGTFTGKIETIDPVHLSFTMQGKAGLQYVQTDNYTVIQKNGAAAALAQLAPGISVSVRASWDRASTSVAAHEVQATVKPVAVDFTGRVVVKNGLALAVVADNQVIYGVDADKAAWQNKNGKPLDASRFNVGDQVRVWGKHISGSVQVEASRLKDLSVIK